MVLSCLCAIRVSREEHLANCGKLLAGVVSKRDVEFLVYSLELGMEAAYKNTEHYRYRSSTDGRHDVADIMP